ncbi:endo-beta-N-acetylglucosaminidase [Streptococcus acidominimus]|uniref:LPXTG cell wall anchor domain-containing protein n=1 Tax=Streptococcus acidominimus TaxID=1326 RepID=A0A4Y9FNL7_STRAI|nr:bacterial Ig-like domain-containing protein [Streptococcus acidominimus]MBF0819268.1 bacterial Ig-like domain-containing protein [Streptococcus acidominimus]MBF0838444.1 bacterial Ig-like domain-containing protein [Streptococcus acidominimus]MBF0846423.1 bacterial Ig-like domain-containing protein [Streptococcus danieliae]TFU30120.1 LPXTG cell wall anchor domain-containing protein [Streptococcus acidominimus]
MTLKKLLKFGIVAGSIWTLHQVTTMEVLAQELPSENLTANQETSSPTATSPSDSLATEKNDLEATSAATEEATEKSDLTETGASEQPTNSAGENSDNLPTEAATEVRERSADPAITTPEQPQNAEETNIAPDSPSTVPPSIRPKEIKFESNADIENWREEDQPDHDPNRATVPLANRVPGSRVVNPLANPEAKLHAVSLMNSKAADHASVGGDEFKAYAFDYWQYVDSITFWDGPIPSPDMIDAAHRNGVPIYGTLFFNWSSSQEDQEKLLDFIKEDSPQSGTFPIARQLAKMAKYYGFDGYFINQETTGNSLRDKGEQMRQFMLYTKEYAQSLDYPIRFAWYDAMNSYGTRYHVNGVNEYNKSFVTPNSNGTVPADEFFANFNWSTETNNKSVETMNQLGRSPFDVYAGFELQARSYNTAIRRQQLLDANGKPKLSIGLYTPDSILGLSTRAEDYHQNENIFWTGHQGDPTLANDSHPIWSGMARFVADKTVLTGSNFHTSFNTGHGKKWFKDGVSSRDKEWNYRSLAGVLPTWRWWIRSNKQALAAQYDFEDAYNGGNSLAFSGNLDADSQQDIMLYASNLSITPTSTLSVSHKGGKSAKIQIGLSTDRDYNENSFHYVDLSPESDWSTASFNLSSLANQKVYAIKLRIQNQGELPNFQFNLGQLSITAHQNAPLAPTGGQVLDKRLAHAQLAEAIIHVDKVEEADYYEVYQQYGDQWQFITGSSNPTIYLSQITRPKEASGTSQALKIIAVGKNGVRSADFLLPFEWGMTTADTTSPKPAAENVVLGAQVIGSSEPQSDGSEGLNSMLNGTITSNSDKWSSLSPSATVDIRLTQPRTIKRWVMDHAGAGGESVNDGLMNTKDFDLYYKDSAGNWKLAHSVRNNIAHVTDIELATPTTAQDWRLHVITSDNGTPWRAIRIYNWKMYESLDSESENLPMSSAHATALPNQHVQVAFDHVPAGVTITLYKDNTAQQVLAEATASQDGPLTFPAIKDSAIGSLIYYRAQSPNKDISNILAIPYKANDKTIQDIQYQPFPKTVYRQGEALDVNGGSLQVHYTDQSSQIFQLTHPAIRILGHKPQEVGKQALSLNFLDQHLEVAQYIFVSDQPMDKRELLDVSLNRQPKTSYYIHQPLDLRKGELLLTYTDGYSQKLALTEPGVQVEDYNPNQTGRQLLTIHYGNHQLSLEVTVNQEEVNTQYLEQKLSEIAELLKTPRFLNATTASQEKLTKLIQASHQLLADETKTNQLLNEQVKLLDQAVLELTPNPTDKPEEVNTQELEQKLSEIAALLKTPRFLKATTASQEKLIKLIQASHQLLADEAKTNQLLSQQVKLLDRAVLELSPTVEPKVPQSLDKKELNPKQTFKQKVLGQPHIDQDKDKGKHPEKQALIQKAELPLNKRPADSLPNTGSVTSPLAFLATAILSGLALIRSSKKRHK